MICDVSFSSTHTFSETDARKRRPGALRFLHLAFSFPFDAPSNYRAKKEYGGGALLDVGSYCIHAARWLAASEPRQVRGMSRIKKG